MKVPLDGGQQGLLQVDVAVAADGLVAVAGWRIGAVDLALEVDGVVVATDVIPVERGDVAAAYGGSAVADCGFVLVAEHVAGTACSWRRGATRDGVGRHIGIRSHRLPRRRSPRSVWRRWGR